MERIGRCGLLLAVSAALVWGRAGAEEHPQPYATTRAGTTDLASVELWIRNDGPTPMTCTAQLAHWYSTTLGTAAPGDTVTARLWHDPATGTLAVLNAEAVPMPVEAITCGPDATRLPLPFATGPAPARLSMRCGPVTGGQACGPAD